MTEDFETGFELIERLKDEADDVVEAFKKKYPPLKSGKPRRVGVVDAFKLLKWQKLIGDIDTEQERQINRSVLEKEDMFKACRLGYEGLDELKDESSEKLVKLLKNLNLKNYKEALEPLGNFILGYKTIKKFCQDSLQKKEFDKATKDYEEVKQRVAEIDEQTDKHIEDKYLIPIQRDYGVSERPERSRGGIGGYSTPDTVWNIEGVPLRNIDDFAIMDVIAKYEKQTGKNAIWRGARTQPFLRFLRKYRREHDTEEKPIKKKDEIVLGFGEEDEL